MYFLKDFEVQPFKKTLVLIEDAICVHNVLVVFREKQNNYVEAAEEISICIHDMIPIDNV